MRKILFADCHHFYQYIMAGDRQYTLQFANHGWDTAYISNPLSPFNIIFGKNKKLIFNRLLNHIKNGVNIKKYLWYYEPFTFVPFHNYSFLNSDWLIDNYYRFTVPSIKAIIKKRAFSNIDVLWLGTPYQKFWKDILDYKFFIYRLGDNMRALSNISNVLLNAQDNVIKSADLILVTSKVLLNEYKNIFSNKEFIYFPNGVDLSNFIREEYKKPIEFYKVHNRIALYIGAIDEWFDFDLLMNVAKKCREISFMIIGPDNLGFMRKPLEKNVYYLGPRKYIEIPNYIYYCDCGIIPFKNSKLVQTICPIKMYEFFSLGKPVVSREWNELKLLDSPCLLAKNSKEFVDILKDKNTFSISSRKLVAYSQENSWYKRYIQILKILEKRAI